MKWLIGVLAPMWLFLPLNVRDAFSASVTLNSGEVMEGTITSETDAEVRLEVTNEKHTIFSTRVIPKAEIKSITRDTPEQKIHQTRYMTLDKCKLYPSQELTAAEYQQGIDAFQKFLSDHPDDSIHAEEIRGRLAEWKAEAANLQGGKVKYANRWMVPDEKKLLSLQQQLAELQAKRNSVAVGVAKAEGELPSLRERLATLPLEVTVQEHVWQTVQSGYDRNGTPIYRTVDRVVPKTVPNTEVGGVHDRIAACQQAINSGRATLPMLDDKIRTIQGQLAEAQRAYEVTLANPAR